MNSIGPSPKYISNRLVIRLNRSIKNYLPLNLKVWTTVLLIVTLKVFVEPLIKVFAGITMLAVVAFLPTLTVISFLPFLPAFGNKVTTIPGFRYFNLIVTLALIEPVFGAVMLGTYRVSVLTSGSALGDTGLVVITL
jgi:hypothetical protein